MKRIPVGEHFAIVDDEDYEWLSEFVWEVFETKDSRITYAMAARKNHVGSRFMHKMITGFDQNDHANGNGLDNRRENLRLANHSQNSMNKEKVRTAFGRNPTSEFKGVCWHKRQSVWSVEICKEGKKKWLGYFTDEIEAAKAYDSAALDLFGEFALVNFPAP